MSHRFFKTAKVTEGVASRLSDKSYSRLKKVAHDVWDIDGSSDEVEAVRKREETAEINFDAEPTSPNVGDLVIFLLGGQKHQARIASLAEDGESVNVEVDGQTLSIPAAWATKIE